jgi:hypothetical protein
MPYGGVKRRLLKHLAICACAIIRRVPQGTPSEMSFF